MRVTSLWRGVPTPEVGERWGSRMRFNPKARLDTSRTRDVGGAGGGGLGGGGLGGGGMQLPTGKMGVGGFVLLLVIVLISQCTGVGPDLGSVIGGASGSTLEASRFDQA